MNFKEIYDRKKMHEVEKKYGIYFEDKDLLTTALIHPSYNASVNYNYQRLEFLGDAVLQMVMSDYLYRNYPKDKEGVLSKNRAKLVSKQSLAKIIDEEELFEYIVLGKSVIHDGYGGRQSFACDIFESIVGAIYLDKGLEKAEWFINHTLMTRFDNLISQDVVKDYKSSLQELLQQNGVANMKYETEKLESGDFKAFVFHDDNLIGEGVGGNKKFAEQQAAKKALEKR